MDLKKTTFAVLAKKQDSTAHKWFKENVSYVISWSNIDHYYIYIYETKSKKHHIDWSIVRKKPKDIPVYTEEEFEMLLKESQKQQQKQTNGFFNENFY